MGKHEPSGEYKIDRAIKKALTMEATPFSEVVAKTGLDAKTVREGLLRLEKHNRATIVYGLGWRKPFTAAQKEAPAKEAAS